MLNTHSPIIESFLNRKNVPFLNGVRGIAILLVVIFHASLYWRNTFKFSEPFFYNFGWTGVNLFFVLSGLLITNILLDTKDSLGYFKTFYKNRILRIFPLYFIIMLAISIFIHPIQEPWMQIFFLSNFVVVSEVQLQSFSLIAIAWSLAIEEQYYFFWPLIVKLIPIERLKSIILLLILFPVVLKLSSLFLNIKANTLFYHTLFRLDGISLGGAIAYFLRFHHNPNKLYKLNLALLVISIGVISQVWIYNGTFLSFVNFGFVMFYGDFFVNLFYGTLILHCFLRSSSYSNKFFELGFLQHFGKLSFGTYMFHYFFLLYFLLPFFYRNISNLSGFSPWVVYSIYMLAALLCSYLIGLASFHLIEKQFLKLKQIKLKSND